MPVHKGAIKGKSSRSSSGRRPTPVRLPNASNLLGGKMEEHPRGTTDMKYISEIARLTEIIEGLKAKVSYYEQASGNKAVPKKKNPYAQFSLSQPVPKGPGLKPERSPSFNRRASTLHVYPPSVRAVQMKGDPTDWYAPDVLIAPPDYYSLENSGPSSDEDEEDEEEEEEEDDDDDEEDDEAYPSETPDGGSDAAMYLGDGPSTSATRSRASSVGSEGRGLYTPGLSAAASDKTVSSVVDEPEVDDEDDSKVGDESEEQSLLEEDEYDFRNVFPYEENLFALSKDFQLEERIGTGDDAIVYRAIQRSTGDQVAIKFRDEYNPRGRHPKELRLLSAVQGHPVTCDLVCWHNMPKTKCHAIVTRLCPNTDIEQHIFGDPVKIRKYMFDLMTVIQFLHSRNVLYRDVKPDNVLWDEENGKLSLIDFDVATFYDKDRLHRRLVGTDGYMAPEVIEISSKVDELEKLERYRNRKNRDELLSKLPYKGYGLPADVYSCGVLMGQLLFSYPQEDIMDDELTERSGEGMFIRARKRIDRLNKLKHYTSEEVGVARKMTQDEYKELLALDLCVAMLAVDPDERITVDASLEHPYFTDERAFEPVTKRVVPYEKRAEALSPMASASGGAARMSYTQ